MFGFLDEIVMMAAAFTAGVNPTSRAMIQGVTKNLWNGIKSGAAYVTGRYNPQKRG